MTFMENFTALIIFFVVTAWTMVFEVCHFSYSAYFLDYVTMYEVEVTTNLVSYDLTSKVNRPNFSSSTVSLQAVQ